MSCSAADIAEKKRQAQEKLRLTQLARQQGGTTSNGNNNNVPTNSNQNQSSKFMHSLKAIQTNTKQNNRVCLVYS